MNSRRLSSRITTRCAAALALIALITAPGFTQKSFYTSAPQVEFAYNYAAVPADPEAIYEGARIVHNVTMNGQKGMRVHAKFKVQFGLHVPCTLMAYFFYDDTKPTPLKSDDPKYRTRTGTVYAHADFTPAYDPARYDDLQIFMPYSALNMESGEEYQLKFYLALYDKEGQRFFGKSGWYKFDLTMP